jgi:hypothetical protein
MYLDPTRKRCKFARDGALEISLQERGEGGFDSPGESAYQGPARGDGVAHGTESGLPRGMPVTLSNLATSQISPGVPPAQIS